MKRTISRILICLIVFSALLAAVIPAAVTAAPVIFISPRAGAPGTRVSVAGSNFDSYAGDRLEVFFNETEVASVVAAASGASFQISFQVPARTQAGDATISIRQNAGNEVARDVFAVPAPEVRLGTWGGMVSTGTTATCRGFYAGKPVTFRYYFDGEMDTLGVQNAGETGECGISFAIPASPRGKHLIIADNAEGQSASVEFEIIPSVSIELATAAVGDKVTIGATGFTAGNEITIRLYDQTVAYATSSARGSFIAQFIVPLMRAGKYELEIKDFSGVVEWGELEIISRLNINRAAGEVGARITLTGTGFEIHRLVSIVYDAEQLTFLLTDDAGAFKTTIAIPSGRSGTHIVTATDGTNTRQVVFTVESQAPPAPVPLTPKRLAVVSMPLTIDWEGVYDVSQPLLYTLEIARARDFLQTVLEKSGLGVSQYTVPETAGLLPNRRGTYYYWRVRATDGAGNAGEWSDPVPFRIKPSDILPSWTRYVLVALQVAIAFMFGFRIWKGLRGIKS